MASAYTPGLKIVSKTLVEKDRKLPLKGEVKVKKGDKVTAETVVAATNLPGNVYPLNIANLLGCEPNEISVYLKKKKVTLFRRAMLSLKPMASLVSLRLLLKLQSQVALKVFQLQLVRLFFVNRLFLLKFMLTLMVKLMVFILKKA